jgi:uncharacterized repeat protein (TIGR01451 family)
MKKHLHTFIIAMFTCFLLSGMNAFSGTVSIIVASDSMGTYCGAPFTAGFNIYGSTTGYAATDSVSVYHNFGDGNDTLFYLHLYQSQWFAQGYFHNYQLPGAYNCLYIVTGPDGSADTVFTVNDIVDSSSCGNIDGRLYIDANSNCTYDIGEVPVIAPVQLLYNNQIIATSYPLWNGYYYFNIPNNSYTIQVGPQITQYGYTVTCPASNQINIPSVPSVNNNFGLECWPGFDLTAYVMCQRFRPGFTSVISPYMHNASCQPVSGQAKLVLDNPLISVAATSVTPDAISGDTLIWNFSNINNQNWANFGYVTVLTSASAPLGDTICVTFIVEPIAGDVNPANNTVVGCREISNSVDPNEKDVNPHGNIMSGDWLTYTIFFQNTGTDTAYHVFILDTINANLDMNTFQPIASSHNYYTYIDGNVVKFDFPNIMLADSNANEPLSHGWVTYRIKSLTGLSNGTSIDNTADIYFDFNAAVITNTTVSIIDNGVYVPPIPITEFSLGVYPNPFTSEATLTISADRTENITMIISDVTGRGVMQKQVQVQQGVSNYIIRTNDLAKGLYVLNVHSAKINQSIKIVRE